MIMRDKLGHRSSEMSFPDRNDPVETLRSITSGNLYQTRTEKCP
jgi:hypothetical protein